MQPGTYMQGKYMQGTGEGVERSCVFNIAGVRALRAVARLGAMEQQVIICRFGLFGQPELSVREIAHRMNMQVGAVRVLERRALREMQIGATELEEVAA